MSSACWEVSYCIVKMSGEWLGEENGSAFVNFTGVEEIDTLDNLTQLLTCAARSLQRPPTLPYSSTLTTIVRSFQTLFYLLILVLGIPLNGMVIVLVVKYKKLQTRSFIIALQVMGVNLFLLVTVYLLRPITSIANQWLFGEYVCIIMGYIYIAYLLVRTLLMFAFVVDRFLSVFCPFSYPKHSSKIMISLCVATWVFVIVARGIGLPGILDCYNFRLSANLCIHSSGCSSACAIATNISIAIIFGPATIIPSILYSILYWKAWKFIKASKATSASNKVGVGKSEWKGTVTFFLLFIAVFVFTTPAIVVTIVATSINRSSPSPVLYVISAIATTLTSLLVVIDPIVMIRNGDVREIMSKIKARLRGGGRTELRRKSTSHITETDVE